MSSDPEGPSPPLQDELSPGRCPNCGRPLKFPENRPEGLCATCGIYVEILKPLARQSTPPLDRTAVQTALRRDLVRLCEERGLDPSGTKADLVRRLLVYLERSPAAGSESGDAQGAPEPSPQGGDVAKRRETAMFHLSLEQALEEPEEEPTVVAPSEPPSTSVAETATRALKPAEPPPALPAESPPPEQPTAPPALPAESPPPEQPTAAPPEPTAPKEPVPTREETGAPFPREFDDLFDEEVPPAAEPEVAPEPEPSAEPEGAPEPEPSGEPEELPGPEPSGEPEGPPPEEGPAEMGGPGVLVLARAEPPSREAQKASRVDEAARLSARMRRDRAVFYLGVLSILFGGIGLFLGSVIHDLLRVPVFGENYSVFGSLNVTAAALGGVFILAGLCAIAFAVRGGIARARPLPGG